MNYAHTILLMNLKLNRSADCTIILWRICSKQELWSQRNSRCLVKSAHNNRGIVTIRDVTRTAVAMERLDRHVSAETRRAVFSVHSVPWGYKKDKENR
jgi:hypothetical protein